MNRPKKTDPECRRQGMSDVPVANYSKVQDKYIDYLERKLKLKKEETKWQTKKKHKKYYLRI